MSVSLVFIRVSVYADAIMNGVKVMNPAKMADEQRILMLALQDSVRYPNVLTKMTLLETHISYVLLTGSFAYKIKKAVNFGFLDFSTLERRRFFCEEELRLNRRLAPQLYLAVVPICGTMREPRIADDPDDRSTPIEYAVKMVEFSQAALFDRRLAQGDLSAPEIDVLTDLVAAFHARAASAPPGGQFGTSTVIWQLAADNFSQLPAATGDDDDAARLEALEIWSRDEYSRLEQLFEERRRAGFIRECHGDLHLGNIARIDETPVIFDCIEFNSQLRWIDVISEVAFLSMDLHERGRPDLAQRFINRYLEATGDYAGLHGLNFYQVYRALVRAKVAGLRAVQETGDDARRQLEIRARYLAFAVRATRTRQRQLLLMHGVSGSGKTWVSQAVLEHLGALRLRSDIERKRLFGLPALARTASAVDGGLYDEKTTRATYQRLCERAREILDAGFPVLVDAACLQRWQRGIFRDLAAELAVPLQIISCSADDATLHHRLAAREQSGRDASEARRAVLEHQLQNNDPLSAAEQDRAIIFQSGLDSIEQLLHRTELMAAKEPVGLDGLKPNRSFGAAKKVGDENSPVRFSSE